MGQEDLSGRRGPWLEVAVAVSLLAVAGAVWWLWGRTHRRPNVILISIDTLRPDHLSCYGYDAPTSPNIDRVAREGVRFEQVRSTSSWTLPAHLALLTGLPDQAHGVVHDTVALEDGVLLLAEAMRRAGYRTGGFFGGPYLDPIFGFGRGFESYVNCGVDLYRDLDRVDEATRNALLAQRERRSHQVITAPAIEQGAERFLEQHRDEPFFLFLHHWDVHYDYMAPEEFLRRFAPPGPPPLDISDFPFNERIQPNMSPLERRYLIAAYDAEIAWVDHHIGRLLEKLEELGLDDDTYVVITADHGEEFFEHGEKGHRNNLFDTTLRIPLVIKGPGLRRGVVVDRPARIFDIYPTILELVGLEPPESVMGRSLVPLMRGEDDPHLRDLPTIAELTLVPKVPDGEGGVRVADWCYVDRAVTRDGFKRIHRARRRFDASARPPDFEGEVLEEWEMLYRVAEDPAESRDLAASEPRTLDRLRDLQEKVDRAARALRARLGLVRRGRDLPPEVRAMLDQIGY